MTRTDTLITKPSIRSDRVDSRPLVSLIEVPAVKNRRPPRIDAGGHAWANARRQSRGPWPARQKRRLRREVRIAGCTLLVLAALASACTLGWSSGPVRVLACSIADTSAGERDLDQGASTLDPPGRSGIPPVGSPGVVVLSIEPATIVPGTDSEVPVIFPGYVLPDDSLEDSTHEGS